MPESVNVFRCWRELSWIQSWELFWELLIFFFLLCSHTKSLIIYFPSSFAQLWECVEEAALMESER